MATPERAQKVLARAGVGSRRRVEELIEAGRVSINGATAELGDRIDVEADRVLVDGVQVPLAPGLVYYLLAKPAGYVCSADDPHHRELAVDLVPAEPRVFTVGRLDRDTEGLLLLTNDGDLAHGLTHPSRGVEKEYLVQVEGDPSPAALRRLREGVVLDDGPTAPARASRVEAGVLKLTIHEGRNRQVRRMCEAVGHPVRRLVRTRIGPISDARLKPSQWRVLSTAEVEALYRAVAKGPAGSEG